MGYAKFPLHREVIFDPAALRPLLRRDLGDEVKWVLIGDGYDTYRRYVKQPQRRTHGMAVFVCREKERA